MCSPVYVTSLSAPGIYIPGGIDKYHHYDLMPSDVRMLRRMTSGRFFLVP